MTRKSSLLIALLALAAHCLSGSAWAATLNIATDVSKSNPLLMHDYYADRAAAYIQRAVLDLKDGDTIIIGSLGDPSDPSNVLSASLPLSRRFKAIDALPQVTGYLANILRDAEDGQSSTHLIRWL